MPSSAAALAPQAEIPNDLEAFWMPFTANRSFKQRPRMIARAKDMFYYTPEGRAVMDGTAGLWCTNAGHNREPIVAAIQAQAAELDFAPAFQFGHPKAFSLASPHRRPGAGRPRPRLLRQFGLGGRRHGAQDRHRLQQRARPGHAQPADRPRARLPRRRLRRHLGRRHRVEPQAVRHAAGGRRPPAPHLQPRAPGLHVGEPEWGAHLADDLERIVAAARRLDDRGRDRRADGGLDGRAAAPEGLPAAAARASATSTASC